MKLYSTLSKKNLAIITTVIALFCGSINANAQDPAGYCTVLHQPCNGDGEVQVTITDGMTLPLTFNYLSSDVIHGNVYSFTDIASGMNYGEFNRVIVTDANNNYLVLDLGFEPSFIVDEYQYFYTYDCPENVVEIFFTINGGVPATNVEYYIEWTNILWGSGNPLEVEDGDYSVVLYDENNCRVNLFPDSTFAVSASEPFEITGHTTPASCQNGTAEISSVTGGVPPYNFLWSTGESGNSITDLAQGYYFVTISDSMGCTMESVLDIQQIPEIDINFTNTNPTCLENNGSITAFGSGGVPPYTYLFSTGETTQTISNLTAGSYSVLVRDANGCFSENSIQLYSYTPISVNYQTVHPNCNESNGSIELSVEGGTPPYMVSWSIVPNQTSTTVSGLAQGVYHFTVTDSEECARTGYVILFNTDLYANIYSNNTYCPDNVGWVNIDASSVNPPIEYLWSNGETGNSIDSLAAGHYTCTISDAAGCTLVKSKTVYELSPIALNYSYIPASCPYTADGSLTAIPTSGTPPYSYYWSDGQTSATAIGLLPGHYSVHVIDANGCVSYKWFDLGFSSTSNDCYCTISGTAFEDLNDNCIFDLGENPIQNIRINCPPYGSVYTNASGEYSFLLPTGDYTLSETILGYYPLETCQPQSYNINVTAESGCVMTYNFAHSVNPIHDIQTNISTVQHAVPGYDYIQKVLIKNAGTIAESNIQFGYAHDGQLLYESSSEPLLSQENAFLYPDCYGITSSFPVLEPGESKYIYLTYQVPTNIPLGTAVLFTDTVSYDSPMSNWQNEYSPWNNLTNYLTYTVGSFDPNNKEVYPKGLGEHGFIANSDSILTYTVNFENTGNYFARKIVVYDTLDTDLDWNTLQPVSSTHDCVTRITDDGVAIFTFDDIYLSYEGIGRYGSVTYSLKQNPDLAPGTEISNSAAIVFDFNEPVITNTVLNTIFWPEGVEQTADEIPVTIFPNPANNSFSVSGENIHNVELINSLGQVILNLESYNNIFIGNLPAGIYFVKIETEQSIVVKKLIIQ